MDKIQILLAEYSTLRAEIIARIGHMYQLIGVSVPLIALLFVGLKPLSFNVRSRVRAKRTNAILFWSIMAVFTGVFTWSVWSYARDVDRLAARIREIELDVNDRAKEDLMLWESLWGDASTGFWWWQWRPPFNRSHLETVKREPRTFKGKVIEP